MTNFNSSGRKNKSFGEKTRLSSAHAIAKKKKAKALEIYFFSCLSLIVRLRVFLVLVMGMVEDALLFVGSDYAL